MSTQNNIFKNISQSMVVLLVTVLLLLLPLVAFAQEFVSLVGIPGVEPNKQNLVGYLNALYILSISFGALFAVVRIALAGVQYSVSGDNASARSKAKNDIFGALFGLAILLATYIVLNTINPNLTNLNILGNAQPAVLTAPTSSTLPSGSAPIEGSARALEQTLIQARAAEGKVLDYRSGRFRDIGDEDRAQQACLAKGGSYETMTDPRDTTNSVTSRYLLCYKK